MVAPSPVKSRRNPAASISDAGGCPICGSHRLAPAFEVADRYGKHVPIEQCANCTVFVPAYPRVTDESRATEQQVVFHQAEWQAQTEEDIAQLIRDCSGIVEAFAPVLGAPAEDGWVAEVGSGRGGLLAAIKAKGHHVVGCEPGPELFSVARKLGGLSEREIFNLPARDFVNMVEREQWPIRHWFFWHVLEHLTDPVDILRHVGRLAKPNDSVIAQFPLLRSDNIFPEHYFLLTEASAVKLGELAGFKLLSLDYDHGRAFMSVVWQRTDAPVPKSDEPVTDERERWLERTLKLKTDEVRRLQLRIDKEVALIRERDQSIVGLELRCRELSQSEAEKIGTLAAQKSQIEMLQTDLSNEEHRARELASELSFQKFELSQIRQKLFAPMSDKDDRDESTDSLVRIFGLHATELMYRHWAHVRGMSVGNPGPTISERLMLYCSEVVPPQLASALESPQFAELVAKSTRGARTVTERVINVALPTMRSVFRRIVP